MKILHTVESYLPAHHGMSEVVRQISENFMSFGHEVTIATKYDPDRKSETINGIKVVGFKISGNQAFGYNGEKSELERYQKFLIDSPADIMTNFSAQHWATDLALPILEKITAKKVFVPTGFQGLHGPGYSDYFEKMKNRMKLYDMNVFLSNDYRDINFARENEVKNIMVITNGASQKEFFAPIDFDVRREFGLPPDCFLILHVSMHTGVKGHRETMEIFEKANISRAALLLVANGTGGCLDFCLKQSAKLNNTAEFMNKRKKILVVNLERPKTVAAYNQADLFLFPSNIECSPIVLFEAMASKTPFLVTDVGNSREIIKWSGGGLLLPTRHGVHVRYSIVSDLKILAKKILRTFKLLKPAQDDKNYILSQAKIDESVKLVEALYENQEQRLTLAQNGFDAWQKKFTWEKISREYENLYLSLLK
jgi:L-malate glycosyltransferase